ncbi:hypothetical protein Q427_01855 [Halomonas sp. BC04]|nr:hypothetical protein Q427_01855 [Halomonas sp. BC04]
MDITDFYDTFFEEAEELLADMERYLLELDVDEPDTEELNAIFRAAHSIKGGAGTFGFDALQKTTHLFENLLDHTRKGELTLRRDIVDTFLETKDMLSDQLDAYRNGDEPDQEAFERICQTLQKLALEEIGQDLDGGGGAAPAVKAEPPPKAAPASAPEVETADGDGQRIVTLLNVSEKDRQLLVEELGQLGEVISHQGDEQRYEVVIDSSDSDDDIEAVMCFIIDADQFQIRPAGAGQPEAEAESRLAAGEGQRVITLLNVGEKDRQLLVEELGQLGDVVSQQGDDARYEVVLDSSIGNEDIEAVMCFIVEADQLQISTVGEASSPAVDKEKAEAAPVPEEAAPKAEAAPKPVAKRRRKPASPRPRAPRPLPSAFPSTRSTRSSTWWAS